MDHHVTLKRIFSKHIRIGLEIVVEILTNLMLEWDFVVVLGWVRKKEANGNLTGGFIKLFILLEGWDASIIGFLIHLYINKAGSQTSDLFYTGYFGIC